MYIPCRNSNNSAVDISDGCVAPDASSAGDPRIVIRGESTSFYSSDEQETRSGLSSIIDFLVFTFFTRDEILR